MIHRHMDYCNERYHKRTCRQANESAFVSRRQSISSPSVSVSTFVQVRRRRDAACCAVTRGQGFLQQQLRGDVPTQEGERSRALRILKGEPSESRWCSNITNCRGHNLCLVRLEPADSVLAFAIVFRFCSYIDRVSEPNVRHVCKHEYARGQCKATQHMVGSKIGG